MDLDRRDFFAAGGLGSALLFGCSAADSKTGEALLTAEDASFETAREAFPWSKNQTFLNNAGRTPAVFTRSTRPASISTTSLTGRARAAWPWAGVIPKRSRNCTAG